MRARKDTLAPEFSVYPQVVGYGITTNGLPRSPTLTYTHWLASRQVVRQTGRLNAGKHRSFADNVIVVETAGISLKPLSVPAVQRHANGTPTLPFAAQRLNAVAVQRQFSSSPARLLCYQTTHEKRMPCDTAFIRRHYPTQRYAARIYQ